MEESENEHKFEKYTQILNTLYHALIEIRATNNIRKANALADVFHNVPKHIISGSEPAEILERIGAIAKRLDCEAYLAHLLERGGR